MIVRRDIPIGLQAAQIVHAAGVSARMSGNLPHDTHAVALWAPDAGSLRDLADRLTAADIPHVTIVESDAPYTGQLMAIGVAPGDRSRVRPLVSSLPLIKGRLADPEK